MLRARVTAIVIGLVLYLAVIAFPAGLAYTEWLGERAVATVTGCHPSGRTQNCRGTWTGADGRRHSGEIDEVYPGDIGTQVRVRIGPFGARAETTGGKIIYLAMVVAIGLVVPAGAIVLARRVSRRFRSPGDAVLATPVPDGSARLFVTHRRIWRPDGGEVAALRAAPAPPGFRPVSPPGRVPHQRSGSVLEAVRWMAHNPSKGARLLGAYNPDGVLLFLIHRPPTGSYAPETAVIDPSGATRAIIRRTSELPGRYALLAPDGHELGSIMQADRMRPDFLVRDEHGRQVGTLTIRRNCWVAQLEDGTPLRDCALAFVADAYRLRL